MSLQYPNSPGARTQGKSSIKQILCKDSIFFLEVIFGGYFLEDGGARVQDGGTDK